MRRKKRKKKIGISFLLLCALLPQLEAAKKKAEQESYAVVAGTIFRDPGFALPNAQVILLPDPRQEAPAGKIKKMQTVANSRGEFVFRVPPVSLRYIVKASAKGYQDQEKPVSVQGEDHVEVTFTLHEESK